MTMDSYWRAVLHEVENKDNTNCLFRYTTVGPKADPISPKQYGKKSGDQITKKKFVVGEPFPAIYFTEREFDCMMSLLHGKTVKEIGVELTLSPRTVEYYIKNLKTKLGCQTRGELLRSALETELIKKTLTKQN